MHNLRTVVRFEITRALKKKSFWIAALAVPVVVGLVGAVIFFSNQVSNEQTKKLATEHFSMGLTDDSGLITPSVITALHAKNFSTEASGKQAVQRGSLDAYFYYPKDLSKDPVRVYGKNVGLFKNDRYETFAKQILEQSVASMTTPNIRSILQGKVTYSATNFTSGGQVDKGFYNVIAPGVFLVLFYFMLGIFGNQILVSATEEKENRVIEMMLVTIKPTTLVVGKILSLVVLALAQMLIILVPIVIGYIALRHQLTLPSLDLSQIPFDPLRIAIGAIIFFVSFLMFTGLLMTLGAATPTAKEAGGFFGGVLALVFGPLYAAPLFVTSPDTFIVQFLSYFPLTAPIPLLLRNAVGNLTLTQTVIAVAILIVTTVIVIRIAVRIFRFGALEYTRRLSFREVMSRRN